MVETLTESFCERCGTRYEFKAPTRLNPLRKTRGLFGGLKNYLTSQDDFGDAMGDAMRSEEEQLASAQLEAFHESFNFCINCRQYTCVNCWNDDAGRCRSCVPIPGTDDLAERLAASFAGNGASAIAEPMLADDEIQRRLGGGEAAWPTTDLPSEPVHGHPADLAWPGVDVVASRSEAQPEPEPVAAELEVEPEPVAAEEPINEPEPIVAEEPEPEPIVAEEPEPIVAEEAVEEPRASLRVVAWEPDAPYETFEPAADWELEVAAEMEPEPVVAEEPEPVAAEVEPETEPEPEPVVAEEPEVEPEPAMHIAPISETILRFPGRDSRAEPQQPPERQAAEDDSPEVAARRAQLDLLGLGDPGEGPVEPSRPAVLPYRSRGAAGGDLAARARRAGGSSFWEASAREVAGAAASIGVQNCGECGLSLSANARFCRRCGTRQARSA